MPVGIEFHGLLQSLHAFLELERRNDLSSCCTIQIEEHQALRRASVRSVRLFLGSHDYFKDRTGMLFALGGNKQRSPVHSQHRLVGRVRASAGDQGVLLKVEKRFIPSIRLQRSYQ
jgi:hypothetical protein